MQVINDTSQTWYSTFLGAIPPSQTLVEIEFLRAQLPRRQFRDVLDIGCGSGRHSRFLSSYGYDVLGIDTDAAAIRVARQFTHSGARYLRHDMRDLDRLSESFDAAVCMSQSFGFFDDATNAGVLAAVKRRLRPHGRVVIDVYNRDFFAAGEGEKLRIGDDNAIPQMSRLVDNRLLVTLDTRGQGVQNFDWRVYSPGEFRALAEGAGFSVALACTQFNAAMPPSAASPRMQFVLAVG